MQSLKKLYTIIYEYNLYMDCIQSVYIIFTSLTSSPPTMQTELTERAPTPGSFNSLNSTLNPFGASTTSAAPPDAWAYAPAYDLAPHLNLLSPSNSPYTTSFGRPGNNGSAAAYSYATMLPQHDASLFAAPAGNNMQVQQEYMSVSISPPPNLARADYQTMVAMHSPPTHLAPEDEHHAVSCLSSYIVREGF